MLIPVLRDRTTKPPLGTTLRTDGHWSVQGLVEAWAFNEGSGAPFTLNKPPVSGTVGWEPRGITSTDAYYQAPSPDLTGAVTVISAVTRTKNIDFWRVSFVNRGGYQAQNNPYGFYLVYNYGNYRLEQFRWVSGAYTHKHTQEVGVTALFPIGKQTVVAIASAGRSSAIPSLYIDGISSATAMVYSAPSANANTDLGQIQVSTTSAFVFSSQLLYNRVLQPSEIASLSANPWQIYEPEIVWVEVGGAATTYTEPLATLADAYATVTDISAYIDAAQAIITAGVSVVDTTTMLESILVTAQAADSISDLAAQAESLLAVIQAADSVQSAQTMVDSLIVSASAADSVSDSQTAAGLETLQSTASAAATVQDVVVALEQFSATISAQATVTDEQIAAAAENLLTAATALTSVTDLQLMTDNLTIIATSGASIGEINAYLEQLAAAATGQASVMDVLVGSFIGRYLAVEYAAARSFAELATARSFIEYAAPRGARA